jgi:Sec-independent protein translocase protein TatA
MGAGMGRAIREFKHATTEVRDSDDRQPESPR